MTDGLLMASTAGMYTGTEGSANSTMIQTLISPVCYGTRYLEEYRVVVGYADEDICGRTVEHLSFHPKSIIMMQLSLAGTLGKADGIGKTYIEAMTVTQEPCLLMRCCPKKCVSCHYMLSITKMC